MEHTGKNFVTDSIMLLLFAVLVLLLVGCGTVTETKIERFQETVIIGQGGEIDANAAVVAQDTPIKVRTWDTESKSFSAVSSQLTANGAVLVRADIYNRLLAAVELLKRLAASDEGRALIAEATK